MAAAGPIKGRGTAAASRGAGRECREGMPGGNAGRECREGMPAGNAGRECRGGMPSGNAGRMEGGNAGRERKANRGRGGRGHLHGWVVARRKHEADAAFPHAVRHALRTQINLGRRCGEHRARSVERPSGAAAQRLAFSSHFHLRVYCADARGEREDATATQHGTDDRIRRRDSQGGRWAVQPRRTATPIFSTTSALPHRLDTLLLPCLAT